jgi:hypothetical protein
MLRTRNNMPVDALLTAAKGIRRACLQALRDQYARLQSPKLTPFLPAPRFSVTFCPFAAQLQKDPKTQFQTTKVRPKDRYDERETCPYCYAQIPVTMHSGLANYRRLLFESHLSLTYRKPEGSASFACLSCYKTFEDPYLFLDHLFQKELGSDRSCQKRWSVQLSFNQSLIESNPALVEKCLKNCLKRESTRARATRKSRELSHKSKAMIFSVRESISEVDHPINA